MKDEPRPARSRLRETLKQLRAQCGKKTGDLSEIFPEMGIDVMRKRYELQGNFGVTDGTRTHDDWNHNPGLYQLSYGHRRDQQLDLLAEQKQDYSDVFIALPSTFFTSSKYFFSLVHDRCVTSSSHAANARKASFIHPCNTSRRRERVHLVSFGKGAGTQLRTRLFKRANAGLQTLRI